MDKSNSRKLCSVAIFSALFLPITACQGPKAINEMSYEELKVLAKTITDTCIAAGAQPGTPEFDVCVDQEGIKYQSDVASGRDSRRRLAAALSGAMGDIGDSYQRSADRYQANAYRPPVTCTTKPGLNGSTQTECW